MDVLELPRPVINFLRTMSKEMHRYSLCWDIYGGSENVTLTLTWKLTSEDSSDSGEAKSETKSPRSPRKAKKQGKQLQHSRLDSLKTCSRFLSDKRSAQSDFKPMCSNLNPYFYTKDKLQETNRFLDSDLSASPVFTGGSNTPVKSSQKNCHREHSRGRSLESYEKMEPCKETKLNSINKDSIPLSKDTFKSDPWIRRDSFDKNVYRSDIEKEIKLMSLIETIAGEEDTLDPKSHLVSMTNAGLCYRTNSGSQTNTGTTFSSSSSKSINGASNNTASISKVTFDPNLEYI